jgi:hypothetical protein
LVLCSIYLEFENKDDVSRANIVSLYCMPKRVMIASVETLKAEIA